MIGVAFGLCLINTNFSSTRFDRILLRHVAICRSLTMLWSPWTLLAIVQVSLASRLDSHSFEPPFEHVDPSGSKSISKDWKIGGVASVSNNFLRLTPDRQSKKGAAWSRKSLGVTTFSAVFTFRISGQGKKFFGDGMALWFINQPYYVEGDFHGSVERFTGESCRSIFFFFTLIWFPHRVRHCLRYFQEH